VLDENDRLIQRYDGGSDDAAFQDAFYYEGDIYFLMGVYSVFESLGQTVGPIVYGTLLTLGYRSGIAVFCVAMAAFTALFAFMMRKDSALYE